MLLANDIAPCCAELAIMHLMRQMADNINAGVATEDHARH